MMIKFFRHIRQQLINQNDMGKYFKYAIGEILLVVIGILIALGINNWNTSNKSNHDKKVAILRIKEEIKNNSIELEKAGSVNQNILNAFKDYSAVFDRNSSEILIMPQKLAQYQKQYPGFFRIKDSAKISETHYRYFGETFIELEIPEITSIAWETTKALSVTAKFSYECLYDLENLYSLQERVKKEIDKAAEALQQQKIKSLFSILAVIDQLDTQLKDDYNHMLAKIDSCK